MTSFAEKIIKNKNLKNRDLAKQVFSKREISGSSVDAYAFIITALNLVEKKEFTEDELLEVITDGNNDYNIDAVYFGEKFVDIFSVSAEKFNYDELNKIQSSITDGIIKRLNNDFLETLNVSIKKNIQNIYNIEKKIRLFLIYKSFIKENLKEKLSEKLNEKDIECVFLSYEHLVSKFIIEREKFLDKFFINIEESNSFDQKSDVLIARVKILEVLELYKESIKENSDLFNKNIRIFLKNKGLKESLKETIENNPEQFFLFHNGISLTVSNFNHLPGGRVQINNPQVVNGAQTISSLYDHYKDDLKNKNLNKAYIVVKIVKADKKLTDKVCETSNTQIPIKLWDLRANDDIHKKIEIFLETTDSYQYLRKSRQKPRKGKDGITLVTFIQWYYSVVFMKPSDAKNKKKSLFEYGNLGKYSSIVKGLDISLKRYSDEILKILKVGFFVKDKISKEKNKIKKGLLKDADFHMIMILKKIGMDKFDLVYSFIRDYVEKIRKSENGITNNKIFTKSDDLKKCLLIEFKK